MRSDAIPLPAPCLMSCYNYAVTDIHTTYELHPGCPWHKTGTHDICSLVIDSTIGKRCVSYVLLLTLIAVVGNLSEDKTATVDCLAAHRFDVYYRILWQVRKIAPKAMA